MRFLIERDHFKVEEIGKAFNDYVPDMRACVHACVCICISFNLYENLCGKIIIPISHMRALRIRESLQLVGVRV